MAAVQVYRAVAIVEVVVVDRARSEVLLVLLDRRNFDTRVPLKLVLRLLAFKRDTNFFLKN